MIQHIAIVGMGTIGHGCALHFALHGRTVKCYDINPAQTQKALAAMRQELLELCEEGLAEACAAEEILARVQPAESLEDAVQGAEYVLENIAEDLAEKQALFAQLEGLTPHSTVLASNTSSLKLCDITAKMGEDGKARAMLGHWYNPGHIMPIVELSDFGNLASGVYQRVEALYLATGKQPVRVRRDVPGLVANRIQHAVAREAFALMDAGVADAEDIDRALKYGPAFRYATTGQLEIADFGGLDMWCRAADNLLPHMDDSKAASPLLRQKVAKGKLGAKTGEGFYLYPGDTGAQKKKAFNRRLIRQLKASREYE